MVQIVHANLISSLCSEQVRSNKNRMVVIYVDDCIIVWTHGEVNLLKFIEHCDEQHPDIRFSGESTAQGSPVSYMDLEITADNNHLRYGLFH